MKDHDKEFNAFHTELMLKGFIETNIKLNKTQQELHQTKEKLSQTDVKLVLTERELNTAKSDLKQAKDNSNRTDLKLDEVERELVSTKNDLHQTRKKLNQADVKYDQVLTELDITKTQLHHIDDKLNQTVDELNTANNVLDQTKKEMRENRFLNFNIFSILQKSLQSNKQLERNSIPQLMTPSIEIGFKEILPFLSQEKHQEFLRRDRDVTSIINNGDLLYYCQLMGNMQSKDLLSYNYKGIFEWLLGTMQLGKIYKLSGFLFFKLPIVNRGASGEIMISGASNLEYIKQVHMDTLLFANDDILMAYDDDNGHRLVYRSFKELRNYLWLYGVENEKDGIILDVGYIINLEWKNHVTKSNELLFRMRYITQMPNDII